MESVISTLTEFENKVVISIRVTTK